MKRSRYEYTDSAEERGEKVKKFIEELKFSKPISELHYSKKRCECPKCHKTFLFYCYNCLIPVQPETHPPTLRLPLNVFVILHSGEHRSKSTSLAASTISPDLKIVTYPNVPEGLSPENTLVLYPSESSVLISEVENLETFKNVVFIESTWKQSRAIARDNRLRAFKHVKLQSHTSLFWRYQSNDPTYLSTVEAIYWLLREYIRTIKYKSKSVLQKKQENDNNNLQNTGPCIDSRNADVVKDDLQRTKEYCGEVDDLLYYYIYQYICIQQKYADSRDAKYTTRHFKDYILQSVD